MKATTATHRPNKRPLMVSVVLKPDELARLNALAEDEVRTKSSMARLLINEAIEARDTATAS